VSIVPAGRGRPWRRTAGQTAEPSNRAPQATAKVSYQNNVEARGAAAVNVTVKSGSDSALVIDDAIRLVWISKLSPLSTIRVGVVYPDNNPLGAIRYVDPEKEQADLVS